jgi:hypothetical protein
MSVVYQTERSNNGRGTIQSGGTTKSTKETTRKGKERGEEWIRTELSLIFYSNSAISH